MSGEHDQHDQPAPPPDEIERQRTAAREAMDRLNNSNRQLTEAWMLPRNKDLTEEQTVSVIERFRQYTKANKISAAQVSRECGISGGSVSEWARRVRPSDTITHAINDWMERDSRAQKHRRPKDYIKTTVAEDVRNICYLAHKLCKMAAVVVPAGAGKTKVLKALTEEMRGVYIYCNEDVTARDLYREIALSLGWKKEGGTRGELLRFNIERLVNTNRIVFVDEAQNAGKHVGCLRSIHDQAHIPIVMAGTDEILQHVNDRAHGRGQFSSRCLRYNALDYVNNAEGPDGADRGRDLFTVDEIHAFFKSKQIRIDREGLRLVWALACLPGYGTLRLVENTIDTVMEFNAGLELVTRDHVVEALQVLIGGEAVYLQQLAQRHMEISGSAEPVMARAG